MHQHLLRLDGWACYTQPHALLGHKGIDKMCVCPRCTCGGRWVTSMPQSVSQSKTALAVQILRYNQAVVYLKKCTEAKPKVLFGEHAM